MKMAARLGWSIGTEKVLPKVGSNILWGRSSADSQCRRSRYIELLR